MRGLDAARMQYVDLSFHALDLYYNLKSLENFVLHNEKVFNDKIDTVICCFPFYYFDFDMSKSVSQYKEKGWMLSVCEFGWHNADMTRLEIKDFVISYDMFGGKFRSLANCPKVPYRDVTTMELKPVELIGSWRRNPVETENENMAILREIFEIVIDKRIIILTPPMYLKQLLDPENQSIFEKKKEEFYSRMNSFKDEFNFEIWDMTDAFDKTEYFADYEHLNNLGRDKFTELILSKIQISKEREIICD